MKFTKNYGLKKPEQNDFYDVVHENDNMDILDEKLNEASHFQGNLSSTYEYDEGFVFGSEGDGSVWEIPRALKVVYDAVLNLASRGVGKNKERIDAMEEELAGAQAGLKYSVVCNSDYVQNVDAFVERVGNICTIKGTLKTLAEIPTNTKFVDLPTTPAFGGCCIGMYAGTSSCVNLKIADGGIITPNSTITSGKYLILDTTYVCL
jgi:hypothetical protein